VSRTKHRVSGGKRRSAARMGQLGTSRKEVQSLWVRTLQKNFSGGDFWGREIKEILGERVGDWGRFPLEGSGQL